MSAHMQIPLNTFNIHALAVRGIKCFGVLYL